MKSTATRIERMLEKIEALASPPRQWAGRLTVIVHELCEGQSREEAFAELKAHYPQNVVGKTVDDLNWSDDVAAAQEKVLAEHIAAHPEDAGCTVEDFRWIIHEIVSPNWRLENDRAVWDEPPPKIDVESEEDGRNDPAGAPTGNGRPEFRTPAPDSNGGGLDGYPDHHRSGLAPARQAVATQATQMRQLRPPRGQQWDTLSRSAAHGACRSRRQPGKTA